MGGQDGFQRTILEYEQSASTILGGVRIDPNERWDLGLFLSYTEADAGLERFDLSAPDYSATHPSMSFDFSQSHTYSDLDANRFDGSFNVKYNVRDDFWLRFLYRYIDYVDDAPYMYDTSGNAEYASIVAGWYF
jgi:hypothetical protein